MLCAQRLKTARVCGVPAAWLELLSLRPKPLKTSRFRVEALGFTGFRAFWVDAVVAFATSPPLGRRTEPEALKVYLSSEDERAVLIICHLNAATLPFENSCPNPRDSESE